MTTLATRLITLGTLVVLLSGLLAVTAPPAQADQPGCGIGTYNAVTDECEISGANSFTGAFSFHHSVRMLAGATLNASGGGITLNVNGAAGLDFSMDAGAVIEANDDIDPPNASAAAITIHATDDITMAEGSRITADNLNAGGNGGAIAIDADGDMTMAGAGTLVGAVISSRHFGGAGDTGIGGNISISVGVAAAATGVLTLGGGATAYGAETGARIDATGNGPSGDISINVGRDYLGLPGSVVASGGYDGTAIQQGGKIYIVAGCDLTTQGRITSKGTDPGADLVHLEGCDVLIQGLVESTGKGHAQNSANSCDAVNDGLIGEVIRSDKPANATACIEVWGGNIIIDSVNGWGELNADIGNGGTGGMSWIDIYALSSLWIADGAGNNRTSDNLGHTYLSTYAVHANQINGSDATPGVVIAKVKSGPLNASGNALQASTTGAGSNGGSITAEASGNVTLDGAWLNAPGDFNPTGGVGLGGQIAVSSWGGSLSWQNGDGDVRPDTGTIALNACVGAVNVGGTDFHGEVPVPTATCDATKPAIPAYVFFNTAVWALCAFEPPPETGSVVVHKTDADTDELVGGATFTIAPNVDVIALDLAVLTLTEVADGIHCIDGLFLGEYLVTETEEPPGYLPADPDSQAFTVDGPSTCADALTREPDLIFENKVIEGDGSITIVKEVECAECETLTRGYYFNRGGSHLEETNGLLGHTDDFGTGSIDADGQTFSTVADVHAYLDADQDGSSDGDNGLSHRGQLTVQYLAAVLNVRRNGEECNLQARIYNDEESPFDGWTVGEILQEAQDAFADESEYTDQEIKDAIDAINNSTHDEENPLTCDEGTTGGLLDGVTFHLFTAADFESEPQGEPLEGETGDDGTGTLIFDNLALGDYVLVESGDPEGLDCEIQSVEASDGADATLEDDGTISITLSDENQGSANITLTVVNDCEQEEEEAIGSLLIAKVDADDVEVLLGGATFTVNGAVHQDADGDGFVCVDGLTLGDTASVQETVAPEGYIGEAGARDFLVLNEATCAERVGEETLPEDADAVFTNEAEEVPESEEFTLTKVNQTGAAIGGVAFNLARTGEYNQTKSTNAAGSVTFTGLLSSRTYTLNETEPSNCTSKDPWTVTVAANGTITITDEDGTNVPAAGGSFALVNTCQAGGTLGGNPPTGGSPAPGGQVPNTAFESGPLPPFASMLAALLLLSILGFVAARNLEAIRARR